MPFGDDPASESNKMELRGIEYHERVRAQFCEMASAAPDRWLVLDGTAGPDQIDEKISRRVTEELESRSIVPASGSAGRLV
jgi:dTMP kinase